MMHPVLATVALLACTASLKAQHDGSADHPPLAHHEPVFHVDEVGVGVAPVFEVNGAESAGTALHAHYIHHLSNSAWGVGADYEHVFALHEHAAVMALLQWSPHPYTHFVMGSGMFHELAGPWNPAVHLEAFQDFHWHGMAIGPFVEYAIEPGQRQMEMGVHLGVPVGHKEVDPHHAHRRHHHD